jgi:CHAT domain-containing protein
LRAIAFLAAILALPVALAAEPPEADPGMAEALLKRGESLQAQGYRQRALQDLEQSLRYAGSDPVLEARVRGALAKAHALAGAFDKAHPLLERALAAARASGRDALSAALLNDRGNLLRLEGKEREALASYREGLALALSAGDSLAAARIATNASRLARRLSDPALTAQLAAAAREQVARGPDSAEKAFVLLAAGIAFEELERADVAYDMYSRAKVIAERQDDPVLASHALGRLGALYERTRRYEDALVLTSAAVFAAQKAGGTDSLYRWQWQSGRLLAGMGRREDAMRAYRRAVASFGAIRHDLILDLRGAQASYRETAAPLYLEFADLLLREAAQAPSAAAARPSLVEVREVIERFKAVELDDYFQDDCVAALQSRSIDVDQVSPNTAVLYPILLPDRIEMLVSLPGEIRQVRLTVDSATLSSEILDFRRRLEKRSTHEYLPHAKRLYDWLIRPLEAHLAQHQVHTLVLVPDGPLRTIPIAALHDGTDFLVARYAMAVAPGLSLIEPQALTRREPQVLMSGLSDAVQNFPALPHVDGEVEAIRGFYGAKVLRNREFIVPSFAREMQAAPYSVVHIASHGHFDRDPRRSFLLSYDGRLTMDQLERVVKQTRFRDDPVELLMLSACRTAAGDDRAALGLAGVAVKAGARSAVATLWYVNDEASSRLVTEFYQVLKASPVSKAAALQAAQRKTLADPRYRHPGYWSPFLLIGNWL